MAFESIETENLSKKIIDQFLKAIAKRELKPGDKIPTLNNLSKIFNVSRGIVRESIKSLENIGLVEVQTRKGIYIKKFDFDSFMEKFLPFLFLDHKGDIIDLLEVRKALEIYGAKLAVKKVSDENLEVLKKILENIEDDAEKLNVDKYLEDDTNFHYEISAISGNMILPKLIKMLRMYYIELQKETLTPLGSFQSSIKAHKEVYEALKNKDTDKIEVLMEEHFKNIEEATKKNKSSK